MKDFKAVEVGEIPFASTTLAAATDWLVVAAREKRGIPIRLPNSYCVALASKDSGYSELLRGKGVNFPDGAPVAWFMRCGRGGNSNSRQVRGPSLFNEVLSAGCSENLSHFFLGGSPDALCKLVENVQNANPKIRIAGFYSPPYAPLGEEFYAEVVRRITKADPDIVWVGLGTPKQDYAGAVITARTKIPTVAVGAAFDFVAGTVKEAPTWIQGSGFEWLFRLASEPRRLWRRYLFGNIQFLNAVLRSSRRTRRGSH